MFYETGKDHGLPFDPFKACVIPRPIGWISTRSPTGTDNLAPYSQFTNLTFSPPYVMYSANRTITGTQKDSVVNAASSGVFGWNLATYALREEMNVTAQQVDYGVDEFAVAGLEKEDAKVIAVSLVKRSPVKFECAFDRVIELPGDGPMGTVDIVIGKVLAIHIEDGVLTDGKIDVAKTQPIARLGYYDYAVVRESFEMRIPGNDEKLMAGLEGSARKIAEDKEDGNGKQGEQVRGQLERAQSAGAGAALEEKQ